MHVLVYVLYFAGFAVVGALLIAALGAFFAALREGVDAVLLAMVGIVACCVAGWAWFSFGDSLLVWIFHHLFGYAPSAKSPEAEVSVSFMDHPVIWFVHLFAYAPILVVFLFSSLFCEGPLRANGVLGRALGFVPYLAFASIFYWHFAGMKLLVSWFS